MYFPIFRQARPDFFRERLQLTEKRRYNLTTKIKAYSITIKKDRWSKLINDKITKIEINTNWTVEINYKLN